MKEVLIGFALMATTLYSGIIFGWAPLQLILEEDGVYSGNCAKTETESCDSQQRQFSLLYTLATSVFMFGGFLSGICVDYFGPTKTTAVTGVFVSIGMLLLGIARPDQGSLFLISGLCLGAGGSLTLLNSFPLGFIVESEFIPLIMTSVNCLFDASAVMFLLCYLVYHHLKASRAQIFITLAVVAAVSYFLLTVVWWKYEPELVKRKRLVASGEQDEDGEGSVDELSSGPHGLHEGDMEMTLTHTQPTADALPHAAGGSVLLGENDTDMERVKTRLPIDSQVEPKLSFDRTYSKHWTSQLYSSKFVFIAIYASVCILRSNSFFGIVKEVLVRLGDDDTGHLYTQLFVACLPLGFLFIPVINHCLVTYGFLITFRVISALGILYGGVVLVPNLESQVVTFLAFTAFRAFMYSVLATYFARMFGPNNAGRLYGSMSVLASGVNFLQYPAFLLFGGSMFYYNLGLLAIGFPMVMLVEKQLGPILVKHPEADVKQAKSD